MRTVLHAPKRHRIGWLAVAAALVALLASPAFAAEQSLDFGGIDVVVWTPDAGGAEPSPVVVFSHGIKLCATQSRFLGLPKLRAPVMYQGGTNDLVFTPPLRRSGGAHDRSPAPKYYVELTGAAHFAWTDGGAGDKATIVAYAFLDRYVKGAAESDLLRRKRPGVAAFRRAPAAR